MAQTKNKSPSRATESKRSELKRSAERDAAVQRYEKLLIALSVGVLIGLFLRR